MPLEGWGRVPRRWVSCRSSWTGLSCHVPILTPSVLQRVPWASAFSAAGDVGTPEAVAPVIVIPPSNRSVVAGSSETTLECIANARCVPVPHAGSNNP